jgi:AraC-like DNA-binding protein
MGESAALISAFLHGLAAGAVLVIALAVGRSALGRDVRIATVLMAVSVAGWVIVESLPLFRAMGRPALLDVLACPVAGLFWLFLVVVFADWKVTPLALAPGFVLLVTGVAQGFVHAGVFDALWSARNVFSAALALHAAVLILRGWSDDLVERRRRLRVLLLSLACLFVLVEVTAGFGFRLTRDDAWLTVVVGHPVGGVLLAALTFAMSMLTLTAQPSAFGAPRRVEAVVDGRAEAADRQLIEQLSGLMAAEAWRREGLTIGDLAAQLETPEHRLRRLINQRLGHKNFADFLNGHRIAAARRRLADPTEARTTVATIAFDLGFGSLGPFNRAFRAATGATPTEWRRVALAEASPELQEAS